MERKMVQNRSSVKLFGKTIELLVAEDDDDGRHKELKNIPDHKRPKSETQDEDQEYFASEESSGTHGTGEGHATEAPEEDGSLTPTAQVANQDDEREKGHEDASNSQDRTPEKPDKNLPCPRCNSSDTKFCYFNNYSVNQPRYFCRNCQRYWTAGGSMRNMPIGAGRRKSKNSATFRYHEISVTSPSGRVPTVQHEDPCQTSSVVLSFGHNLALCEPTLMLNCSGRSIVNDHSCRTSVPASNGGEDTDRMQNLQQYSIGPPCIYPWNPYSPSISPISFSATPIRGTRNIPRRQSYQIAPSTTAGSMAFTANSPLGKHSRDGYILKHGAILNKNADRKCIWSPRNLRIDDPDEAANSSICLMVPNGKCNGFSKVNSSRPSIQKRELLPLSCIRIQ